jgi:phospholipid transport system substrate-binding protein
MRQLTNVALAGLFMVASLGAYAKDCNTAKAQVEQTTTQVLNALKANQSEIHNLVKKKVLPSFDFRFMSRQVVPKACWNEYPKKRKRRAFVKAFRNLLVRTYSSALQGAGTVNKITYSCIETGSLGKRKPKPTAKVITQVYRNGESQPIKVDYAVYYNEKKNKWKVYNVYAAGSSLVDNYKSDFTKSCNKGGMNNLIKDVKNKK